MPDTEVVELRGVWLDNISAEVEATRARVDSDFKQMATSVGQPTVATKGLADSYRGLATAKGVAMSLAGEQRALTNATQASAKATEYATVSQRQQAAAMAASVTAMQAARGAALANVAAENQLAEAYRNRSRAMGGALNVTGGNRPAAVIPPVGSGIGGLVGGDLLRNVGMAAAGLAGIATVSQAISTLAANMHKAGNEALLSERATFRLTAALRLQGGASEENIRALQGQADAIERLTGVDDKAIQQAQQLALTLGGKTVPETMRMTRAAVNLSAALDSDVTTAMLAIVKASENGGAALARLGIKFESTGDSARDSVAIMELIEKKLGTNFAENAIGPVARKLAEMANRIEQNDEALGTSVNNWKVWFKQIETGFSDAIVAVDKFIKKREEAKPIDPMQEQRDFYNKNVPANRPEELLFSKEQMAQSRAAADKFLPGISGPNDSARRFFDAQILEGDQNKKATPLEDLSPRASAVTKEMQEAWEKSMKEGAKSAADATAKELAEVEKKMAAMSKSLTVHLQAAIEAGFGYGAKFGFDYSKQGRDHTDQFGNPVFPDETPPRRQLQYQETDYGNASRIPETDLEQFLADEKKIEDARREGQEKHAALVREWGDFFTSSLEETFRKSGDGISILEMAMLKLVDSLINATAKGGGGGSWLEKAIGTVIGVATGSGGGPTTGGSGGDIPPVGGPLPNSVTATVEPVGRIPTERRMAPRAIPEPAPRREATAMPQIMVARDKQPSINIVNRMDPATPAIPSPPRRDEPRFVVSRTPEPAPPARDRTPPAILSPSPRREEPAPRLTAARTQEPVERILTAARKDHWMQPARGTTNNTTTNNGADYSRSSVVNQNITVNQQAQRQRPVTPLVAMTPFASGAYGPNFNPLAAMMDDTVVNQIGPQLAQLQARGWK